MINIKQSLTGVNIDQTLDKHDQTPPRNRFILHARIQGAVKKLNKHFTFSCIELLTFGKKQGKCFKTVI